MMRISMMIAFAAAALPAAASDGSGIVAEMAERILARGYGATCSLSMIPVPKGGYYPCLDIGPYRVVKEYGRVSGYVVREGRPPFLVMTSGEMGKGFVTSGPWESDMPSRFVAFWNEVVDGGLERERRARAADAERKEAEEYVRRLAGPSAPGGRGEATEGKGELAADAPRGAGSRESGSGGGVLEVLGGAVPGR